MSKKSKDLAELVVTAAGDAMNAERLTPEQAAEVWWSIAKAATHAAKVLEGSIEMEARP